MPRTKQIQSPADALTTTYAEEAALWEQFKTGGVIACKSEGKAINLRQRMYVARQFMQQLYGITSVDDLIIKRPRGDNRLTICKRDSGILELLPNDPVIETDDIVGIAREHTQKSFREMTRERDDHEIEENKKEMDDLVKGLE